MIKRKDLSLVTTQERQIYFRRVDVFRKLLSCTPAIIFACLAVTLFSLYITGNFNLAFQGVNIISTVGRFLTNLMLFIVIYFAVFFASSSSRYVVRDFSLVVVLIIATFLICLVSATYFNVYSMAIIIAPLIIFILLGKKLAVFTTAGLSIMIIMSFLFNADFEFFTVSEVVASVVCNSLGALIVLFFVERQYTRLRFLLVSFASAAFISPFVIASTLASGDYTINLLFNLLWSYGANIIGILIFMPLVAIFEGIFNMTDDFRLNELCNLNSPLLKRLASEAPGTFNHSLVVGNLAEACATAINENPNLARCCAYYHDIGKLKAPIYFSENQSTYNPHDELIPEVSVSMITSHTIFGEILGKEYRLPNEVVDVCRQHHGTAQVGYFYRKALNLKEDGELAVSEFTYAGPKPQTKISAIIMISDTIEAALRASMPETRAEYENKINILVDEKMKFNQFDECPITTKDIATIKSTIIEVLPSIHHSRIEYSKKK